MNKQAYEASVRRVLEKKATPMDPKEIETKSQAQLSPWRTASSIISSTPSSLVLDALSLPVNLSSAGSASSGSGIGSIKYNFNKGLYNSPTVSAISMLFPNLTRLYTMPFIPYKDLEQRLNQGAANVIRDQVKDFNPEDFGFNVSR